MGRKKIKIEKITNLRQKMVSSKLRLLQADRIADNKFRTLIRCPNNSGEAIFRCASTSANEASLKRRWSWLCSQMHT